MKLRTLPIIAISALLSAGCDSFGIATSDAEVLSAEEAEEMAAEEIDESNLDEELKELEAELLEAEQDG